MFIKVNRISHNVEGVEILKETLINTDLIASVKEMVVEPTKLYDEDGNVVKVEEPTTKVYHVYQTVFEDKRYGVRGVAFRGWR